MLDDLDDRALDELPFGVVCLNARMQVVRMNRAESEASGIQRWRALGRDFFMDIASGDSNKQLAEHVMAFAAGEPLASSITHTFRRRGGADSTTIELVRGSHGGRLYLCIKRWACRCDRATARSSSAR
jgi:photoactive yellow protein